MKHSEFIENLVPLLGGKENVVDVIHCHTRLRFTLKDKNIVEDEQIAALDGVMTTRVTPNQYQVVVGSHVKEVFDELLPYLNLKVVDQSVSEPSDKKKNIFVTFAETMSAIFTPLIISICGSGLMTGIQILLLKTNIIDETNTVYIMLGVLGNVAFYFLPFLVAVSAAERFKCNKYMAITLVAVLMHPTWMEIATTGGVENIYLFDVLPIRLLGYSSAVIPPILTVYALSKIEKLLTKIVPGSLSTVVIPFLELIILGPIVIALIGPLSQYLSDIIANGYLKLYAIASIPASLLFGAFYPIIVLSGTHLSFVPLMLDSIGKTGVDYIMPLMSIAHCGLVGAAFAVYCKTKSNKLKGIAATGTFVTAIGLTEPALYGVALPLKRPLIISCIASGIGGAFYGIFKVSALAIGLSPLGSIPIFFTDTFIYWVIGGVGTVVLAFIGTWLWGYKAGDEKVLPGYKGEE